MIKKFISVSFLLISTFSYAETTVVETAKSFRIEYKNSKDAAKLYDGLKLPLLFGDAVTGVKQQYKMFTDSTGSVVIYCDASDLSRKRCFIEIAKNESTPLVAISHANKQSAIELYDKVDVLKLLPALDVESSNHGGFLFKVISPEDLNASVSCLEKMDDPEWKQCVIRFFHENAF